MNDEETTLRGAWGASGAPRSETGLQETLRLLADRRTTPARLREIAEDRRWSVHYRVRSAIVFRPDTPLVTALRLLPTLWWRDIARVVEDPRLYPPVRARAEQILCEKVGEMTWGEQTALARIASRGLILSLRESCDPRVVGALLGNPRVCEEDVLLIARSDRAPASTLSTLARNARWGGHYTVKLALAQNPSCPLVDSLRSLRGLLETDLKRIANNPAAPRLVRVGASRHLAGP